MSSAIQARGLTRTAIWETTRGTSYGPPRLGASCARPGASFDEPSSRQRAATHDLETLGGLSQRHCDAGSDLAVLLVSNAVFAGFPAILQVAPRVMVGYLGPSTGFRVFERLVSACSRYATRVSAVRSPSVSKNGTQTGSNNLACEDRGIDCPYRRPITVHTGCTCLYSTRPHTRQIDLTTCGGISGGSLFWETTLSLRPQA